MRNLKLNVLAASLLILASTANAHDYSPDLNCRIVDISGKANFYSFTDNTFARDRRSGTMVETGYQSNGRTITSEAGNRPIWFFSIDNFNNYTVQSQDAPGWQIILGRSYDNKGIRGAQAWRVHNNTQVGSGDCVRGLEAINGGGDGSVSDVAPD
jgi:hypothetical protein